MERLHCHIRAMRTDDRGQVVLLGEEVLKPLAIASGHPELYRTEELLDLVARAEVYVALPEPDAAELAGFVALEADDPDTLAVRCVCVAPAFEARQVAHQLLEWVEGLAYNRGAERIQATLSAHDTPSQHLFQRHEFVRRPSETSTPQLILLEKRLATRP